MSWFYGKPWFEKTHTAEFKYILCLGSTWDINDRYNFQSNLNTSYVLVLPYTDNFLGPIKVNLNTSYVLVLLKDIAKKQYQDF